VFLTGESTAPILWPQGRSLALRYPPHTTATFPVLAQTASNLCARSLTTRPAKPMPNKISLDICRIKSVELGVCGLLKSEISGANLPKEHSITGFCLSAKSDRTVTFAKKVILLFPQLIRTGVVKRCKYENYDIDAHPRFSFHQ
jgi:hypothetical protein